MEFYNSALIQDEILLNLSLVIDRDHPAGPSFLHSLGTLVEAVILHEQVYFDPARQAQDRGNSNRRADGTETVGSIIYESPFVQELMTGGGLTQFPDRVVVDDHLEARGSDYNYISFINDLMWMLSSFCSPEPGDQMTTYEMQSMLMEGFPGIFQSKDLVEDYEPDSLSSYNDPTAALLALQGFPVKTLLQLEGWNRIGCAYTDMSRSLGVNLYLVDVAIPHHLGGIQASNLKARELYEAIESRLDIVDSDSVGNSDYYRLEIPPLCQMVLDNSKDSRSALADEVLQLRHRHRKFRQYLTEYEIAWSAAKTRDDRLRLKTEFDNAWKTLTTAEDRPSTRLIYRLWDILKSPTKILEKVGDTLADRGKEISVIEQVRGLHDFWHDLVRSPVPDRNPELLKKLFPSQVGKEVWNAANEFNKTANKYMKQLK